MSLRDDMDMYYRDSFLGYRLPSGKVVPFWIDNVSTTFDEGIWDEDEDEYVDGEDDPYGPAAYEGLQFSGQIVTSADGASESKTVTGLANALLVLDNPELGFVNDLSNSKMVWMSYTPQRSVKKGITGRRIGQRVDFRFAWQIWDAENNGRIHKNLKREGGLLWYKTVCVGIYTSETSIDIEPEAEYLKKFIEEETECQVHVSQP